MLRHPQGVSDFSVRGTLALTLAITKTYVPLLRLQLAPLLPGALVWATYQLSVLNELHKPPISQRFDKTAVGIGTQLLVHNGDPSTITRETAVGTLTEGGGTNVDAAMHHHTASKSGRFPATRPYDNPWLVVWARAMSDVAKPDWTLIIEGGRLDAMVWQ